jgi:putative ABC transport system ATP-binding protein
MLELERVVKHYRAADNDEVRAVDGVSLEVRGGEMVALQGPSGSGKTTLLLLIAGLLEADAGVIRFAGREISSLSEDEASEYLMREVGFIYQSVQLMPRTSVLENASLKLILGGMGMREAKAHTTPWLEHLGLAERQRVAIARALAGQPRLILADEPTGNLDSARSMEIVQLLHTIAGERGAAVVLVTHDIEAALLADRRYRMRDGRLANAEESQDAQQPVQRRRSRTAGG